MRVLHLRSEYLDNGPGTQPLKIAKEFRKRGIDSIFSGASGYMDKIIEREGFEFYKVEELARTKRSVLTVIKSIFKIRNIIKSQDIDVVHTHNAACSFVAFFSTRFLGRKVTIARSVRGVEVRSTHQYRNLIYKFYPAKLLAVCDFAKNKLLELGANENNITVTYNGADLEKFDKDKLSYFSMREAHGINKDEILIGHVGAFSGWKGQEVLVRTLRELNSLTDKTVKVMFVGNGVAFEEVKHLTKKLDLEEQVIFVGRQLDSESYHMAFDIYCQPSVEGELFPNSIVEALALGKPWVGSDISGLAELTNSGKAGIVVEPNNTRQLSSALMTLIESEHKRVQMGERAYDFVLDKLTIQKVCDRIHSAYIS